MQRYRCDLSESPETAAEAFRQAWAHNEQQKGSGEKAVPGFFFFTVSCRIFSLYYKP